jgi:hypothetical protein
MECSATIGTLSKALAAAQGEIRNAAKDTQNPFFKSKYADLASVRDAIQAPFAKHGIAYVQFLEGGPETVKVTTMLMCGEEWMRSTSEIRPVKADPQGVGSAVTYLRRYGLSAAAGVAPEDDDVAAASNPKNGQGAPANNVSRGNPLRQEFAALSFELDACKSQEQIDLLFDSPEFKDFEERDSKQSSGMSFAGHMKDRAEQMRKKLPEKIRYEGNKIVATTEHEAAISPTDEIMPEYGELVNKCFEKIDLAENVAQLSEASAFIVSNQTKMSEDDKKTLGAAYRARAKTLKEKKAA